MENNLGSNSPEKWHQKMWWLAVLLLVIGPLALPILWRKARLSRNTKITLTAVVLILTVWAMFGLVSAIKSVDKIMSEQMEILRDYGIK
jgi:hypothetical protein